MINPLVSYFDGGITNTTKSYKITIEKLYSGITTCQKWRSDIDNVRAVLLKYGKGQEYKAAKKTLSYFIPGGVWSDRTKSARLLKDSKIVQIDIDNVFDPEELQRIRQVLINDKHTLLQFLSPSALGLKAFFVLPDGYTKNHRLSVAGYFKEHYAVTVDPVVLVNNKTASYVSYDEQATLNMDCKIFDILYKADPEPLERGIVISPVIGGGDIPPAIRGFCVSKINRQADKIANAPEGKGSIILNKAAFEMGKYHEAGLPKEKAMSAFFDAFMNRNYSPHTIEEFQRIFDSGYSAGAAKEQIPIEPAIQRK